MNRTLKANLPEMVIKDLKDVADKHGISMTQALRRAIEIQKYIEDILGDGGVLVIEKNGRKPREIVFS